MAKVTIPRATLARLDTANMTLAEIAARTHVSNATVRRALRLYKLPFKRSLDAAMQQRVDETVALYQARKSVSAVASDLNVRQATIVRRLALAGITAQAEGNQIITDPQIYLQIMDLRRQQLTIEQIAQAIGKSESYVTHALVGEGSIVRIYLPRQVQDYFDAQASEKHMLLERFLFDVIYERYLEETS